jgi:hypothetical protein
LKKLAYVRQILAKSMQNVGIHYAIVDIRYANVGASYANVEVSNANVLQIMV